MTDNFDNLTEYVSFEQATELKSLGCDIVSDYMYIVIDSKRFFITSSEYYDACLNKFTNEYYYAPILSQVQKWLREKKNLSVEVYSSLGKSDDWEWDSFVKNLNETVFDEVEDSSISHKTYEEALSLGINKAIQLLKN